MNNWWVATLSWTEKMEHRRRMSNARLYRSSGQCFGGLSGGEWPPCFSFRPQPPPVSRVVSRDPHFPATWARRYQLYNSFMYVPNSNLFMNAYFFNIHRLTRKSFVSWCRLKRFEVSYFCRCFRRYWQRWRLGRWQPFQIMLERVCWGRPHQWSQLSLHASA